MNPQLWSWLLAAIGVTGIFLAGRKASPWIGWTVGLAAQLLWVAYAVVTGQWGFLASAVAYGTVYGLNVRRALAGRRAADTEWARRWATALRQLRARPNVTVNTATAIGRGSVAVAGNRPTPGDPTGALGPNATECPVCPDHRRVANPLLDGHLYLHHLRGER